MYIRLCHEHKLLIHDFAALQSGEVSWCSLSFLHLRVATTKCMIVGFRKSPPSPTLTVIRGSVIEPVDSYKYVLTDINSKPRFLTERRCGIFKGQQGLFFLRKMNPVNATVMTLFYQSFVESVLTFCLVAN